MTDIKPLINNDFSYDIGGKRVGVYLTGIPDYDNGYCLVEGAPTQATHYVVMVQLDGGKCIATDYDDIGEARYAFLREVSQYAINIV
jgi:hypothetical protein